MIMRFSTNGQGFSSMHKVNYAGDAAASPVVSLATQQALRSWDGLLDVLPAGVCVVDSNGIIVRYNRNAAKLWGYEPQAADAPIFDGAVESPVAQVLRTGLSVRDHEGVFERPDGRRIVLLSNVEPLFDSSGSLVGAVGCFQDITDRKHTEFRLAAIVASSDDAIISKTLEGIITSWNTGASRIFGYECDEMIGQPILRLIPEHLHSEEVEILTRLRRGERIDHYETIRIRKDGTPVNISLTVSPLYDAAGHVIGASKIARDITDRVQAEERQKSLVDELNHRVKNTLATVQALAAQTIRGEGITKEVLDVFNARLLALSKAHDQLSREGWQHADLRSVIAGVFAPYASGRVTLEGANVLIPPKVALTLAMVLHELATNAAKYGALSVPSGMLDLKWHVTNNNRSRLLCLDWQESSGPPVGEPKRRGFGTRLIDRAISTEMEGRSVLQFAPAGVRCHIEIPLAA
jgi:PAS domain S-box-containing protein